MGQVSAKLRRRTNGFSWWCPACDEGHPLPDAWTFNGNLEKPTFSPSFKHEGLQTIKVDGKWNGEWKRGADGEPLRYCCHYIVTDGRVAYCGDCTHGMAGQTIDMPDLPLHMRDVDA
jgi:hypothetical protein